MRAYLSRTSAPTPVLIRAANGFQIILGKVRPNTSPGREPSTSSDHCSKSATATSCGLHRTTRTKSLTSRLRPGYRSMARRRSTTTWRTAFADLTAYPQECVTKTWPGRVAARYVTKVLPARPSQICCPDAIQRDDGRRNPDVLQRQVRDPGQRRIGDP